jgi:hypothetical protein
MGKRRPNDAVEVGDVRSTNDNVAADTYICPRAIVLHTYMYIDTFSHARCNLGGWSNKNINHPPAA